MYVVSELWGDTSIRSKESLLKFGVRNRLSFAFAVYEGGYGSIAMSREVLTRSAGFGHCRDW